MFDLMSDPNWIMSQAFARNKNPLEIANLSNAYQKGQIENQQTNIALQNQQAGQQALQGSDLTRGLTPEIVGLIMQKDPELGLKLQTAMTQQMQADPMKGFGALLGLGNNPPDGAPTASPAANPVDDTAAPQGAAPAPPADPLNKYPPAIRNIANDIYTGQTPVPTGAQMRSDPLLMIGYNALLATHPDFSAQQADQRKKMLDSLANGPDANKINSISGMAEHANSLLNDVPLLENGQYRVGNAIKNWAGNQESNPILSEIQAHALNYGGEKVKYLTGGQGGSQQDRQEQADQLSYNKGPGALKAALGANVSDINGVANGTYDRFRAIMGPNTPFKYLSPDTIEKANKAAALLGDRGTPLKFDASGFDAPKARTTKANTVAPVQYTPQDMQAEYNRRFGNKAQ